MGAESLCVRPLFLLAFHFLFGQHTSHRLPDFRLSGRFGVIVAIRFRDISDLLNVGRRHGIPSGAGLLRISVGISFRIVLCAVLSVLHSPFDLRSDAGHVRAKS